MHKVLTTTSNCMCPLTCQIVVGDCVEFLMNCIKSDKKFDYVFADLTDIPISPTPQVNIYIS